MHNSQFVPLSSLVKMIKDDVCGNSLKLSYTLPRLKDLETLVDVLAIVLRASDSTEVSIIGTDKKTLKRKLILIDQSASQVSLTLWGNHAHQYNMDKLTPIIAFNGVRVSSFGGRCLDTITSSKMQINPDIEECRYLGRWFASYQESQSSKRHLPSVTIHPARISTYGMVDPPQSFSTQATILDARPKMLSYPHCSHKKCNKWDVKKERCQRCEKCYKALSTETYCYRLAIAIYDHSGNARLRASDGAGEVIYGRTANELLTLKNTDQAKYHTILDQVGGHTFNFTCWAKAGTKRDCEQVIYEVSDMVPLDFHKEARMMRDLLYSTWAR